MKDYSNDNSIGPFDLLIESLTNIATLLLDYQIQVPSYIYISKGGFQNGSSGSGESESEELKEALLEAVQTWVEAKSNDLSQVGNDTMLPDTDRVQCTNVTTAGELLSLSLFSSSIHTTCFYLLCNFSSFL
jgi:hypothetical protein